MPFTTFGGEESSGTVVEGVQRTFNVSGTEAVRRSGVCACCGGCCGVGVVEKAVAGTGDASTTDEATWVCGAAVTAGNCCWCCCAASALGDGGTCGAAVASSCNPPRGGGDIMPAWGASGCDASGCAAAAAAATAAAAAMVPWFQASRSGSCMTSPAAAPGVAGVSKRPSARATPASEGDAPYAGSPACIICWCAYPAGIGVANGDPLLAAAPLSSAPIRTMSRAVGAWPTKSLPAPPLVNASGDDGENSGADGRNVDGGAF
mmetsp:Transcript_92281/g.232095  ORF Transcript_92281/g.232095 Transcript_92281/m.232095 type:complete len:262 (-) Transcript_92281:210-995(-)